MMNDTVRSVMKERFGKECLISVATMENNIPYVRTVCAYYEDGYFYVVTYTLSKKMQHIVANPQVAVCGDWFSGHGIGENLGHVLDEKNAELIAKLREVFANWYYEGDVDEADPNTCIMSIRLTDGILKHAMGKTLHIDFTQEEAAE